VSGSGDDHPPMQAIRAGVLSQKLNLLEKKSSQTGMLEVSSKISDHVIKFMLQMLAQARSVFQVSAFGGSLQLFCDHEADVFTAVLQQELANLRL
jgi:hypothetical protein